jgi:GT2 family glycosyltransferase
MTSNVFRYERPQALEIVDKPYLSVAIVIACRGGQEKLDLTVASLAAQNYPQKLVNLYIVDDGSDPALKLPPVRPRSTKIIRFKNTSSQWGKTDAVNFATSKLRQDVLWFLDADMIVEPSHLSHHMKWHHDSDDFLVLGWKRFVENWTYDSRSLRKELVQGNFSTLHQESFPKKSWEAIVEKTNDLRNPTLESFRAVVGASFSISRKMWVEIGGYSQEFRIGEDTEFGWRALLAGVRLVPERAALSWHLGISTIENNRQMILQHNKPNFAHHIPNFGYLRDALAIDWVVPENEVLIDVRHMSIDSFETVIGQFFSDDRGSAVFRVFGAWKELRKRYSPTDDSYRDLREIRNYIGHDQRFVLEDIKGDEKLLIREILDLVAIESTPFVFFVEGDLDPKISFSSLRGTLLASGNGLEGIVDREGFRTFGLYAPALARAKRFEGSTYLNLEKSWGIRWREIREYDALHNPAGKSGSNLARAAFRVVKRIRNFRDVSALVKRVARTLKR